MELTEGTTFMIPSGNFRTLTNKQKFYKFQVGCIAMPQNMRVYVVEGTDSTPFSLIALENLPAQDIGGGVDDGQW